MPEAPRSRTAQPKSQLTCFIDPGLKARLTVLANRLGCFESRIIRDALETYITNAEKGARR
jgi:predicted DNA-binding protein